MEDLTSIGPRDCEGSGGIFPGWVPHIIGIHEQAKEEAHNLKIVGLRKDTADLAAHKFRYPVESRAQSQGSIRGNTEFIIIAPHNSLWSTMDDPFDPVLDGGLHHVVGPPDVHGNLMAWKLPALAVERKRHPFL